MYTNSVVLLTSHHRSQWCTNDGVIGIKLRIRNKSRPNPIPLSLYRNHTNGLSQSLNASSHHRNRNGPRFPIAHHRLSCRLCSYTTTRYWDTKSLVRLVSLAVNIGTEQLDYVFLVSEVHRTLAPSSYLLCRTIALQVDDIPYTRGLIMPPPQTCIHRIFYMYYHPCRRITFSGYKLHVLWKCVVCRCFR